MREEAFESSPSALAQKAGVTRATKDPDGGRIERGPDGEPTGALPSLVYIWENASERAFHERTAAAILVLLAFMIVMNAAAIVLRRRFERRW